ncbi:MAG TPA: hypothetical protein DHN33_01280 [Eubacteriaceae bacterium]|nr:hypothetical protein [Eubacteriaceae bacterium]
MPKQKEDKKTTEQRVTQIQKHENGEKETMLLIDQFKPLLLSMIKRYGYCDDTFDDSMQSALEVFIQAIDSYDRSKNPYFAPYLKKQLFYSYMDRIRLHKKLSDHVVMTEAYEQLKNNIVQEDNALTETLKDEERKIIEREMKTMPPKKKQVLFEHFMYNKSIAQIAGEQQASYQSVLKRKNRALKDLKDRYNKKIYH